MQIHHMSVILCEDCGDLLGYNGTPIETALCGTCYNHRLYPSTKPAPAPEPDLCRYCLSGEEDPAAGMCADCYAIEVADYAAYAEWANAYIAGVA